MKINYKGLTINFGREDVPESNIKWYGSTWANPEALLCEGGETLMEMCHSLYTRVESFKNGTYTI
jgi:hypothetical protein